jgi:hypothetical protein
MPPCPDKEQGSMLPSLLRVKEAGFIISEENIIVYIDNKIKDLYVEF